MTTAAPLSDDLVALMTAPCPACGVDVEWVGLPDQDCGMGTAWTIHCECEEGR